PPSMSLEQAAIIAAGSVPAVQVSASSARARPVLATSRPKAAQAARQMLGADLCMAQSSAPRRAPPAPAAGALRDGELGDDRPVIRGAIMQDMGPAAVDSPDHAAVEAEAKHVPLDMGRLARSDVAEAVQRRRAEGVVVADHGGGTFQRAGDAQQLQPVQQLAMG